MGNTRLDTTASLLAVGALSRSGRAIAVDRACRDAFTAFFGKAIRTRVWSPWHDLPIDEIQADGHFLSEGTIRLLEGFLAIEEYVGDYVLEGLQCFGDDRTRRSLQLQWGAEEMRHGAALAQVLLHSGARTEAEIDAYLAKAAERPWTHVGHAGMDEPLGATVYMMVQERATHINYVGLRRRIRAECGLPMGVTTAESAAGQQRGVSEALRLISADEVAHHAIFLEIVKIHLQYFPEATLDRLKEVVTSFRMPGLRFIPGAREFMRLTAGSGIFDAAIYRSDVLTPILKTLGVTDEPVLARWPDWTPRMTVDEGLRSRREQTCLAHMTAENAHEFERCIAAFAHPRYEVVPTSDIYDGAARVGILLQENVSAFPDFQFDVEQMHHADAAIVVEGTFRGTHQGTWRGLPATGRRVDVPMVIIFRFEGEDMVCERVFFDLATVLVQLGVMQDPNAGAG